MIADFRKRAEVSPVDWDEFVSRHNHGWFFHSTRWLDYAMAYTPKAQDLSFAGLDAAGQVQSVVPMVWHPDHGFVHGGQYTPRPIGTDLSAAIQTGVCAARAAERAGLALPLTMWRPILGDIVGMPNVAESWNTFVLDLRPQSDVLWSKIRKSYRSLIHRAEEMYELRVCGANRLGPPFDIMIARDLHREAAGRQTRSDLTWDFMGQWLQEGLALCATAWTSTGLRGYAYALRWKGWAYYASGSTLDDDLQAALVWQLATTLKADGRTQHFEIGWGTRTGDDQKDRGIAFFKSGFGGQIWTVGTVTGG